MKPSPLFPLLTSAMFFASPLAAYVSGANLLVHGGGEAPAYLAAARE